MSAQPTAIPEPPAGVVLERGQTIDRFVVLGLVGRGGMGEVYAAYDPELDRKVAIKLLRARDAADGKSRLLREAQAIAKLQHPNVVVVYDVGTHGDAVFIAMEFIEGRTVNGWLQSGQRTRREILEVYLAAGRGLAAAHAAGLVHRDFKPDNVMVTNDGQVRVMDFGLARHVGEGSDEVPPDPAGAAPVAEAAAEVDVDATMNLGGSGKTARPALTGSGASANTYLSMKLTQTGAMLGTPAYMAPEQFAARRTDERTDQFSFCVALYEALYDQRPFAGDNVLTLMTSVTTGAVQPAPAKAMVPGWLRRALLRGLAVQPDQRHPSMGALLAALTTDPTVRVRRLLASAGVVACLLVAALGVRRASSSRAAMCRGGAERLAGVWEAGESSGRKTAIHRSFAATGKSYAEAAFASASHYLDDYATRWSAMYTDACEATHLRGEQSAEVLDLRMACLNGRLTDLRALTDVFAGADAKVVENAVTSAAALPRVDRCADVALLRAVVQPPADEATRARVDRLRAQLAHLTAVWHAGRCSEADPLAKDLLAQVQTVGYKPLLSETLAAFGVDGENCVPAPERLQMLQDGFAAGVESHHDEAAAQAAALIPAIVADRLHQPVLGRQWLQIARAQIARIGGNSMLSGTVDNGESLVLQLEGRGLEGAAAAERARQQQEKALGPEHPYTIFAMNNEGMAFEVAGQYDQALAVLTAARDLAVHALGAVHPYVGILENNRGEVLNLLHRYPEAHRTLTRTLEIWTASAVDPMAMSYARTALGLALLGERHPLEAIEPLAAALEARLSDKAAADLVGETRFALAHALWAKPGQRARAQELAHQARADYTTLEKATGVTPPALAQIDAWLAAPVANL
ncbi:MAG TPA: serine/threonine-protein kinase [Polyangia bacterium]|nr:serine/threonine-protein kinase [Polyangia bacterium]